MIPNNFDKIDVELNEIYFKNKKNGTFLQAGAFDGISDSITYSYEKQLEWSGILVEPNKHLIPYIKKNRSSKDLILNAGLGQKNQVLQFELLPSRLDSSSFVLNQEKKEKLKSIGFNGQSYKEYMQVLSYDSIIKISGLNKIDIAVIDIEGLQNVVLKNIINSRVKPTFVIAEYIHSDKDELKDIMIKNYDNILTINKDIIFKKRYNVFIITRCCRPDNLDRILNNLNKTFQNTEFNFTWLIACNAKFLNQNHVDLLNKTLVPKDNRNVVLAKLFKPNGCFRFDSDLINMAFFSEEVKNQDYVYVLDDDNIIHENFLNILRKYIESNFDLLTVNIKDYLGNINNLPIFCHTKIDTANMIFNYEYLKNMGGFNCSYINTSYVEDFLTMSKAIQNNAKIIYSQEIGAYYNYLKRF